jgi:hypothetical protein
MTEEVDEAISETLKARWLSPAVALISTILILDSREHCIKCYFTKMSTLRVLDLVKTVSYSSNRQFIDEMEDVETGDDTRVISELKM